MKFIINADDIGLTKSTTNCILRCIDSKAVNSTSILANGADFENAINELKKREGIRVAVHLNLHEGKPVSEDVELLTDENGLFHFTFQGLILEYLFSNKKNELKRQIKSELKAQILKVKNAFNEGYKVNIDSHQHFHMLPFVFEQILEINDEIKIDYVRIPNEPFILPTKTSVLKNFIGLNPFKIVLLKGLAKFFGYKKKLLEKNIQSSDYFVGILATGDISVDAFKYPLKSMRWKGESTVEFMFHPGCACESECSVFRNHSDKSFYISKKRGEEERILNSTDFKKLLECN